jgi:hypothetical protein
VIICDLCAKPKNCLQKEIDGREYDICSECWNSLAQKLRGKGRAKEREIVFLPAPTKEPETEDPEPSPGKPPKIWGAELLNEPAPEPSSPLRASVKPASLEQESAMSYMGMD